MTLLELLISISVGLMIITLISTVYVLAKKNRHQQLALITILENAKTAILILKNTIPYAGFALCHKADMKQGLIGEDNIITVSYANKRSALIVKHESSSIIWVSAKPTFHQNDLVILSDCHNTEFATIHTVIFYHDLQKLSFLSPLQNVYAVTGEVSRFNQDTFFVHPTTRKNKTGAGISALYVKNFHHKQIELVEGVDEIKFKYDVLYEGRLVSVFAKAVSDWSTVKGVSITLKLSSTDGTPLQKEWHTYIALRER